MPPTNKPSTNKPSTNPTTKPVTGSKNKATYDPLQTPAGQEVIDSGRALDAKYKFINARRKAMDEQSPGSGSLTFSREGTPDEVYARPERDRYTKANDAYNQQQSAAKSGFAQHLGTPPSPSGSPAPSKRATPKVKPTPKPAKPTLNPVQSSQSFREK